MGRVNPDDDSTKDHVRGWGSSPPPDGGPTLFDVSDDHRLARNTDPVTSHMSIPSEGRRSSIKERLMKAFDEFGPMTAREACVKAEVIDGWKRVSEMKRDGILVAVMTRDCRITGKTAEVLQLRDQWRPDAAA